jgi:ketol-acid reductoisomerase
MQVYHDRDADLSTLEGRRIAVIGYGNQGRAQALNLRDSGLDVVVGNRDDDYAARARGDGFPVLSIERAAAGADIVMLLIPDEVAPAVFESEIAPHLAEADAVVFASGYDVAFGCIALPPSVDVVLVAPRMIGAGVRDLYVAGHGFPSFIGVHQDHSGRAKAIALALARGIGSTRTGVVEVTFAQEAELDLFTEQCFGPAFGHVLMTAVDLLLEEGYPPEAVLLELYMSGELSYTLGKIAELGMVEQSALHSRTSQYGSMSRGMRFRLPDLRARMREGLEEIRSGAFAREWTAEQEEGCPTLGILKESARSLPLYQLERELRQALQRTPRVQPVQIDRAQRRAAGAGAGPVPTARRGEERPARRAAGTALGVLGRLAGHLRRGRRPDAQPPAGAPAGAHMESVLRAFIAHAVRDPALQAFASGRQVTTHYVLSDRGLEFYLRFQDGVVTGDLNPPPSAAEVRLEMEADVLDGMFTGRINAARAAMAGKLSFGGDTRLALGVQRIQQDLSRLYNLAREQVAAREA